MQTDRFRSGRERDLDNLKIHRRRTKKWIKTLLRTLAALVLLAACTLYFLPRSCIPAPLAPVSEALREAVGEMESRLFPQPSAPVETYPVVWVIDGDTLLILKDGEEVSVRLIGIDAPESVNRDETKNTPEGEIASAWLKDFIAGRPVALEFDEELVDRFGRTLAYVYTEGVLLEDEILRAGMAVTLAMDPNTRYAKHFASVEREAREAGAGFWGTGFFHN